MVEILDMPAQGINLEPKENSSLPDLRPLSPLQRNILVLGIFGIDAAQIARDLGLNPHTLTSHQLWITQSFENSPAPAGIFNDKRGFTKTGVDYIRLRMRGATLLEIGAQLSIPTIDAYSIRSGILENILPSNGSGQQEKGTVCWEAIGEGYFRYLSDNPACPLNPKEKKILSLVAVGLVSQDIGPRVGLATKSVHNLKQIIIEKMGVKSTAEAAVNVLSGIAPEHRKAYFPDYSKGVNIEFNENERNVLKGLTEGKSDSQIAKDLWLSKKAIGNNCGRIYSKLNTRSRIAAGVLAILYQLI